MIPTDFTVTTASWGNEEDRAACIAVREQVFTVERNVSREDELDAFGAQRRSVNVDSREQAAAESLLLIEAARRELCIYSRDLDPALFETDVALEALKRLGVSGRGTSIRIIVQEPRIVIAHGHRLIPLTQ